MRPSLLVRGVQGLGVAIKKEYPDLIRTYNNRWTDPAIQGKTVALDATLITTRFFYTQMEDDALESKRIVMNWHRLVSSMTEAGVKPIAVFDEPGPREWKAREHLRRQAQRSLNLARSLLEDARRERLVKVENVLQEARALLQAEQLPAGTEVDIENELLDLDEAVPTQDSTAIDEDPGRKTLQQALLLLRECRASSRPGEKHTTRSVDQILMDRSSEEEGEAGPVDVAKEEPRQSAAIDGGDAASTTALSDCGFAASLKHVEEQLARMPLIHAQAETSGETVVAGDPMLLEPQEDDVEDIATVVVEPSLEFTETVRQMALTANENYIVSDIIKTMTSDSPSQLALLARQQELRDLQDRSKVVSKIYERSHAKPTAQDMEEARELLGVMGVPVIQAPSPYEAEGLCAAMVLSGMADYAGTEDSDVLVYGALLLKNVGTSTLPLQSIDGEELRTTLGMTDEQYRDFLILCGTDACERIHGIGFKRALKLIKEHSTIETVLDNAQSKKVPLRRLTQEGYLERVGAARRVFSDLPSLPTEFDLQQRAVEPSSIDDFLRDRHGVATLSDADTVSLGDEVQLDSHLTEPDVWIEPDLPKDVPDWMVDSDPPIQER